MTSSTVVLLGDVGMGKSTLVEKVTGCQGLSSNASQSFTRSSHAFLTACKRMMLIDTPGSNAMEDKLEHNVWIAHALNYAPVSLILLVVKAEMRIDNSVKIVRDYAERFGDLIELLGLCITHMDQVSWSKAEFSKCVKDEVGLDSIVFVGARDSGANILNGILQKCHRPTNLSITSENFLKYFKISNSNIKILKSVREEVANFEFFKQEFTKALSDSSYSEQDKIDMVFEFQAFMSEEVYAAQKRVSDTNAFTFCGSDTANQAGHIANLTNQLRAVLLDVRTMALGYQSNAGISQLRKCPHCNQVWAKLEGCDGGTTCGNKPTSFSGRFQSLANFRFKVDGKRLVITKANKKPAKRTVVSGNGNAGCGKSISWRDMAPVQVPAEFAVKTIVTVDDVGILSEAAKPKWNDLYGKVETKIGALEKTLCR